MSASRRKTSNKLGWCRRSVLSIKKSGNRVFDKKPKRLNIRS